MFQLITIRTSAIGVAVLSVLACFSTGPVDAFVGDYELQSVNGSALPYTTTAQGNCDESVVAGSMGLAAGGNDHDPIFGWSARATITCPGKNAQPVFFGSDSGTWSTDGHSIFFKPFSGGSYSGAIGEDTPIVVTLTRDGATYRFLFRSVTPTP